jgi:glycine cleavage system H lipoate-binding protein
LDNISLVPIDKNENGKIDFMEDIYDNLQDLSRGVWIGKYPKALSGNIYAAASTKPENSTETAFLQWVLTGGQEFLSPNGYCDLVSGERQTQLDKLRNTTITVAEPANDTFAVVKIVLLVLLGFVMTGFIIDIIGRYFRSKKRVHRQQPLTGSTVFDEESVVVPKGLYFDKTHTWAFMAEDGKVKIGIDDFLQHITGPITRIEMKNTGEKIKKGDRLLTLVQKGKQLTIHAPVTGTIIAQNKTLTTNTSMLNTAPYTDGWVYTIEPSNWLLEIQFLTMAEKYRTWLKGEFTRLKDFFATAVNASTPEYAHIAYQDGGAFKDHILADLGPAVWEDFQTNFIDNSK